MTTVTQARLALRGVLENGNIVDSGNNPVPLRFANDPLPSDLPEEPAPLVYVEFLGEGGEFVEHGRGRGHNRFRNFARAVAWVFVPQNTGLDQAELIATQIADLTRSYKDSNISCERADVYPGGDGASLVPPGMISEVGSYFWATAETWLSFDLVG